MLCHDYRNAPTPAVATRDRLKIDKSFVQSMTTDGSSATIARAVISSGHGLDLDVLAEGVETEEQASLLLEYGCDMYQGFLFGRPMPALEMRALLRGT